MTSRRGRVSRRGALFVFVVGGGTCTARFSRRSAKIRRFLLVDVDVVLLVPLVGLVGAAADAEHLEGVRDCRLDGFDDLLLRFFDAALFSSLLGLELAEGAAPSLRA